MAGRVPPSRRQTRAPACHRSHAMSKDRISIGIVGARGHIGTELIRLVAAHPRFDLAFVSSRALDGQPVADHNPDYFGGPPCSSPVYDRLQGLAPDALGLACSHRTPARC